MDFCIRTFFKSLFIYLEKIETGRAGEGQREGERESQAGSQLSVQSPTRGSNSRTMRPWPEPKPRVGCLTAPPRRHCFMTFHRKFCVKVYLCPFGAEPTIQSYCSWEIHSYFEADHHILQPQVILQGVDCLLAAYRTAEGDTSEPLVLGVSL